MRDTILVLTNTEDGSHTDVVISKLLSQGERVFRFDSDKFSAGEATITFSSSSDDFGKLTIACGGDSVRSEEIKSVWYRRPNHFNLSIRDQVQKDYAEKEIRSFLEGAWSLLEFEERVFFLSKPSSIEKARKKLLQLKLALTYGMRIPRTVITNNPEEVMAFYESCRSGMIFKAVNHEFLNYGEKSYNIPTTLVTEEHLKNLHLIRRAPAIFQELVPKKYELRVTVVGNKVFPVQIDSQKNPLTVVDWRNPFYIDKLNYEEAVIDSHTERFCLEMLRTLDLKFGAFDFIVDKTDSLYFLEVNPNGQWYWLENLTGVLISDAIASMLKNGTERR